MALFASINRTLRNLVTRKSKVVLQTQDIDLLQRYEKFASSFASLTIGRSHPLHSAVEDAKNVVVHEDSSSSSMHNLNVVTLFFNKRIATLPSGSFDETTIRLYLARNYFERLKQSLKDNDISSSQLNSQNISRLIDVVVLGTASERIEGNG